MKNTLIISSIIAISMSISTVAQAATYHVTHNKMASWSFSCNIVTKGNRVTAVKDLSIKPIMGTITNRNVTLSGGAAHIKFIKRIQALTYHESIKVGVANSKVYVTTN